MKLWIAKVGETIIVKNIKAETQTDAIAVVAKMLTQYAVYGKLYRRWLSAGRVVEQV